VQDRPPSIKPNLLADLETDVQPYTMT
jgi:hypothetical protein